MKISLYISLLLLVAIVSQAQRRYEAFDVLEGKIIVPPNGILLRDSVFMDDSEVMNSHYLEYLHFLAQDSSDNALIRAYPDTTIFGSRHLKHFLKHQKEYYKKKKNGKRLPISTLEHDEVVQEPTNKHHWWNYFSYHGTKHCPVVGISYQQALTYCQWRSKLVTEYFKTELKGKPKYKDFADKNVRFEFSLPSIADWELAASAGLDPMIFPLGFSKIEKDSLSMFNIDFVSGQFVGKNKSQPEFIFAHVPNTWGYYNLIGNVSEMTSINGTSKGGSYLHHANQCHIKNAIYYSHPERWLGFRCVCKVIIEPIAP